MMKKTYEFSVLMHIFGLARPALTFKNLFSIDSIASSILVSHSSNNSS